MKKKISTELLTKGKIACPYCKVLNTVAKWDLATHEECNTRERRRAYISLDEERAYKKETGTLYMCPACRRYVYGYMIKPRMLE